MRLLVIVIIFIALLPAIAKKDYQYQNGWLQDIKTERVYNGVGPLLNSQVYYYHLVKVGDITYIGESLSTYPDFIVNSPVQIRFHGSNLYLKRNNGKELRAEVIKKVRQ